MTTRRRILIVGAVLVALGCVVLMLLVASGLRITSRGGAYGIESTTLSRRVIGHEPVDPASTFAPIATIYCTVTTIGADGGIVGMRWIRGAEVVYEVQGKTRDHTIISYIEGTAANPLPVGDYRVEIFILDDVAAVAEFQVMEP